MFHDSLGFQRDQVVHWSRELYRPVFYFRLNEIRHRIIYCGMDDKSGESALYDRVALRFKGGSSFHVYL